MEILAGLGFWSGLLLCLPCGFLLVELISGVWRLRPLPSSVSPARAVLLIPAHDEGAGIARTLELLAKTGTQGIRVIVIADNCADQTAEVARAAGAEVFERTEDQRRGKPYALGWALEQLATHPPDVVIFLDADCWFREGSPALLASQALSALRPVQGIYRLGGKGLSSFAFSLRNEARLRGLQALGAPVQITGSGFAVPWELLRRVPVPLGELAEDAVWGWSFCRAGSGALLAADSVIGSDLPATAQGARVQRRRWEHGILSATLKNLPALSRSAFVPPRWRRMLHLFDVLVPPLSLLALALMLSLALGWAGGTPSSMLPAALALGMLTAAVLIGWSAYGRATLSLSSLMLAPFYALKKLGLYASFLFRREKHWVRTQRDSNEPGS